MKAKQVYEFVRGNDPIKSLSLGYEGKIRSLFRQYDVPDTDYEIKENGEIVFSTTYNLNNRNIVKLPDNLTLLGLFVIHNDLFKFPNNLTIYGDLSLRHIKPTELPLDLEVKGKIYINKNKKELINFIQNSKFKYHLIIL